MQAEDKALLVGVIISVGSAVGTYLGGYPQYAIWGGLVGIIVGAAAKALIPASAPTAPASVGTK